MIDRYRAGIRGIEGYYQYIAMVAASLEGERHKNSLLFDYIRLDEDPRRNMLGFIEEFECSGCKDRFDVDYVTGCNGGILCKECLVG